APRRDAPAVGGDGRDRARDARTHPRRGWRAADARDGAGPAVRGGRRRSLLLHLAGAV
ncbi:MAG: hypothetical protein AVDCRST_MAG67-1071, partial [uncultured Solirubrobacteraceae bacterium]